MAWFIQDQERSLFKTLRHDELYGDMLEFLRGPLANFAGSVIAPAAWDADQNEKFNVDHFRQLGELGFMAMYFPDKWGGLESSFVYFLAGLETLAKADAGFTLGVAIHGTATTGIQFYGNEAQQDKYIPKLAGGEMLGAFALSEAGSGSDAKNMSCTCSWDEGAGEFVLNGTKYWITNGMDAECFFVFAMDPEVNGVSAFIVERGWSGSFETQKIEGKMGVRASNTAEMVFDNYRVSKEQLVGERGKAFKFAMNMLNGGRTTIAAWATGVAQAAYEKLVKYSHEREIFGGLLKDLPGVASEIAQIHTRIRASREMAFDAGFAKDQNETYAHRAAEAKVFATETSFYAAERAIELCGGYGYVTESRVERHLRDAILGRIGEGANEVLNVAVIPRFIFAEWQDEPMNEIW